MTERIWIGDDVSITWQHMQDANSGDAISTASVNAQLKTSAGVNVGSSVAMLYVATTDSDYRCVIDSAVTETLASGSTYYIDIDATYGDHNGFRRVTREAGYHGEAP